MPLMLQWNWSHVSHSGKWSHDWFNFFFLSFTFLYLCHTPYPGKLCFLPFPFPPFVYMLAICGGWLRASMVVSRTLLDLQAALSFTSQALTYQPWSHRPLAAFFFRFFVFFTWVSVFSCPIRPLNPTCSDASLAHMYTEAGWEPPWWHVLGSLPLLFPSLLPFAYCLIDLFSFFQSTALAHLRRTFRCWRTLIASHISVGLHF